MMKPLTLLIALAASLVAVTTHAGIIDLRLDVSYAGANPSAGGTWKLFSRTNESGLFSLTAPLTGVNASITNELPRGRVNGSASDNAGFSIFVNQNFGDHRQLYFGQQVTTVGDGQQGVFYGVGTLNNGSPNFPGRVANTTFLGPNITSLTSVQDVPWAGAEDTLWTNGVTVASGSFAAGATPAFALVSGELQGSLLTSIGSISTPGDTTLENTINTSVRTNLSLGIAGDFNSDGKVDLLDLDVVGTNFGLMPATRMQGDANGDMKVDLLDLDIVGTNFGAMAPAKAASIPEPSAMILAAFSLLSLGRRGVASGRRVGIDKDFGGIA